MIKYKPTLIGKIARIILPFLNNILPNFIYNKVYRFLYNFYKKIYRCLYYFKFLALSIFGNRKTKLRSKLTYCLLPYSMGGAKSLENAFDLTAAINENRIAGSIVECGVAEGGTSAMMALTNRELDGMKREKWLFDSFEGLPEPTEKDYLDNKTGDFIRPLPKGSCLGTIEQVSELMFGHLNFSKDEIYLIKGWFQNTIPEAKHKIGKIALLRLDGDWYESTMVPLKNLFDLVVKGGYVIIDDYATCYGSRRALDEFIIAEKLQITLHEDYRGGVWFEKI